uniref:Midasin n=1 Tax=Bursaphelenchus xylophilus TaxID=6326 RepID=A0A1I7S7I5_BURXY
MKKRNKVKGFESRLAEAVLLLKKNRLLLFSGPLFSGRSSLAKAIAKCSEPSLNPVFVSFDDQIDSKTLFGSYQSSGIPGDFSWEASSFMDALASESTLIVIKSWETANADTQNAVIQLATDGVVILPGNRRVEINPTSRMIGITSDYGVNRNIPFPLTLNFHPLSKSEMLSRLSSCRVSGVKLDELYELFIKIRRHIETLPHSERRLMTRDFFVLCNRLDGESASVTDIFLDLVDVFVSHLSKRSYQEAPLQEIASFLSIASNSVEFIEKERDVTISVTKDLLTVGRKSLKVERRCLTASSLLPFAPTRSYRVLMEKIAACVANKESVLLNGETGIGKTRLVQELAHRLNIPLDTINLSLDSEAADIVGGFKPVNIGVLVKQLLGSLFLFFGGNPKLKEMLMHLLVTKKYCTLLNSVSRIVQISMQNSTGDSFVILSRLLTKVEQLLNFASNGTCNTPFTFVVGILIKAMNEGHWLLLDEINMGTSECLNGLSSIISEQLPSAHPNFRLFACMNPATDSGKKMLSQNVRALFTEFFVHPPRDFSEISEIIRQYIVTSKTSDLANFYLNMSSSNPRRFSLRNLCRSLLLIKDDVFRNVEKSTRMALTLGFNDGNATNLSLIQVPFKPLSDELRNKFILVEGVFFPRGPNNIQEDPDYIRTASVQTNVQAIAAAAASGRFPVLLEGETSTGKTTVITHLAKVAGYTVYRINNHEQTDIQEYVGSYVPNKDNKLEFQEGVLLKAVRNGDWVILDELNLAPTEVLEALNRLLDDNRELVVPERDICVKAHPNFRLFATQNPAGLYGGRKKLSRAFLNRFVVIKFDQPPKEELVKIVSIRCEVSESAAKLMIQVMLEMKVRRSNTRLFNSTGLMTLRDLFRWGNRVRLSEDGTDWRQELCNQGFFLLASKNRTEEDSFRVKSILEGVLKRTIDVDKLYSVESPYFPQNLRENCSLRDGFMVLNGSMVLTSSLIRMIVLFNEAAKVNEPILLVGETGCGKTAVTYLMSSGSLEFINCHERTDVSDLLGSIRPASDGLFHWQDGVVIRAMKNGSVLLIDEISLANDSVLERLNSMLEPSRMILLADSGASSELVTAVDGFKCVATMNPGGDYGKKEVGCSFIVALIETNFF